MFNITPKICRNFTLDYYNNNIINTVIILTIKATVHSQKKYISLSKRDLFAANWHPYTSKSKAKLKTSTNWIWFNTELKSTINEDFLVRINFSKIDHENIRFFSFNLKRNWNRVLVFSIMDQEKRSLSLFLHRIKL